MPTLTNHCKPYELETITMLWHCCCYHMCHFLKCTHSQVTNQTLHISISVDKIPKAFRRMVSSGFPFGWHKDNWKRKWNNEPSYSRKQNKMTTETSKKTTCLMDKKMEKQKMWYVLVTLQTCIDWNFGNNVNAPKKKTNVVIKVIMAKVARLKFLNKSEILT
jgi:hypothetical protein